MTQEEMTSLNAERAREIVQQVRHSFYSGIRDEKRSAFDLLSYFVRMDIFNACCAHKNSAIIEEATNKDWYNLKLKDEEKFDVWLKYVKEAVVFFLREDGFEARLEDRTIHVSW